MDLCKTIIIGIILFAKKSEACPGTVVNPIDMCSSYVETLFQQEAYLTTKGSTSDAPFCGCIIQASGFQAFVEIIDVPESSCSSSLVIKAGTQPQLSFGCANRGIGYIVEDRSSIETGVNRLNGNTDEYCLKVSTSGFMLNIECSTSLSTVPTVTTTIVETTTLASTTTSTATPTVPTTTTSMPTTTFTTTTTTTSMPTTTTTPTTTTPTTTKPTTTTPTTTLPTTTPLTSTTTAPTTTTPTTTKPTTTTTTPATTTTTPTTTTTTTTPPTTTTTTPTTTTTTPTTTTPTTTQPTTTTTTPTTTTPTTTTPTTTTTTPTTTPSTTTTTTPTTTTTTPTTTTPTTTTPTTTTPTTTAPVTTTTTPTTTTPILTTPTTTTPTTTAPRTTTTTPTTAATPTTTTPITTVTTSTTTTAELTTTTTTPTTTSTALTKPSTTAPLGSSGKVITTTPAQETTDMDAYQQCANGATAMEICASRTIINTRVFVYTERDVSNITYCSCNVYSPSNVGAVVRTPLMLAVSCRSSIVFQVNETTSIASCKDEQFSFKSGKGINMDLEMYKEPVTKAEYCLDMYTLGIEPVIVVCGQNISSGTDHQNKDLPLGTNCIPGRDTCISNAVCQYTGVEYLCTCEEEFHNVSDSCVPKLPVGARCVYGGDVCVNNAVCLSSGEDTVCTCHEEFYNNDGTCLLRKRPGAQCMNTTRECIENASCVVMDGVSVCSCNNGFFVDGDRCSLQKELGEECHIGVDAECIQTTKCNEVATSPTCVCDDQHQKINRTCVRIQPRPPSNSVYLKSDFPVLTLVSGIVALMIAAIAITLICLKKVCAPKMQKLIDSEDASSVESETIYSTPTLYSTPTVYPVVFSVPWQRAMLMFEEPEVDASLSSEHKSIPSIDFYQTVETKELS